MYILKAVAVILSPHFYNRRGECKVIMTHRVIMAMFMGNAPSSCTEIHFPFLARCVHIEHKAKLRCYTIVHKVLDKVLHQMGMISSIIMIEMCFMVVNWHVQMSMIHCQMQQ